MMVSEAKECLDRRQELTFETAEDVFSSKDGRSTLFNKEVPTGWRPKGWKEQEPAPKRQPSALPADEEKETPSEVAAPASSTVSSPSTVASQHVALAAVAAALAAGQLQ